MRQSGEIASELAPEGGRLPRGRSFEVARGVAWLSGLFAFCSVTELLPWPESGAAAARPRRAQFAVRAGSHPGPTPTRPGQAPYSGAGYRGQVSLGTEGVASGRGAGPSRPWAGEGRCHRAPPCTGGRGRAGVLGAATWGSRGSGQARLGAPRTRDLSKAGRDPDRCLRGRASPGARAARPTPRP